MVLVGAFAVFARLVWLQLFLSNNLSKVADSQYHARIIQEPRRGTIFDRNGRPLTTDLGDFVTLGANPSRVTKRDQLAKDLAKETGRSAKYFLDRLNKKAQFVILARKVSPESADKLDRKGWNLIRQPDTRRFYPHHSIAGQLIGLTDIDNKGIAGIELSCDPVLRGTPGWRIVQLDVRGRQHLDASLPSEPAIDGIDVALTIDLAIQTIAEEELLPALKETNAISASALIIDPRTGEILAMGTVPGYDPNEPEEYPQERQKIRPATDLFEPGSTFKLIGASLLLEKGLASPASKVDATGGKITVANHVINDAHNHGVITFREAVALSSNVGMIKLCNQLNPDDFYGMVKRFGFLTETGVELGGEAMGILPKTKSWNGLTKANLIIGHGVAVTMMQLAMAYGAIANDGVLMEPTIIRGRYARDGTLVEEPPLPIRRVVASHTAKTLTDFFVDVVEKGTAPKARIEGLQIAGKTGTAQKIRPEGGYFKDRFYSSFVGYFPARAPRYLILVTLDDPKGLLHQGGQVAAPVFQRIAQRIVGLNPNLKVPGKVKGKASPHEIVAIPEVRNQSAEKAVATLEKAGFEVRTHGEGGIIRDQFPAGGTRATKKEVVELTLGPVAKSGGKQVVVPYLTGLSLREAVKKGSAAGLVVQFKGSGRVVRQTPISGARASVGDIVTLLAAG